MKKEIAKCIDKLIEKTLRVNVNSTTSIAAYQPKLSEQIKNKFEKTEK